MTIEEIRKEAEGRTTLNDCRLYQGRLANEQASHVRHLLRVVALLAAKLVMEQTKHYNAAPHLVEHWIAWADKEAGAEVGAPVPCVACGSEAAAHSSPYGAFHFAYCGAHCLGQKIASASTAGLAVEVWNSLNSGGTNGSR